MWVDMLMKNSDTAPKNTERCLKSLGGIVALSPSFHCKIENSSNNTTKPTSNPMILPEFQADSAPPY